MNFIDLEHQQCRIRDNIERRIRKVLDHGNYIMGPEVFELEEKLAAYVNVRHCVSCANGTDALLLALMAYGIGPGDAVFTTPFTFIATAEVIALLGATPVFVDIDDKTFNISPAHLDNALGDFRKGWLPNGKSSSGLTARGIIAVDLFGLPADYDALKKIADEYQLFLVEDGAQSFGGSYQNGKSCSFGDIATTSFFPAKPLGCYGDGGAIFTNNDDMAEIIKSIRIHGKGNDKYDNIRIGMNGRLDTLQAAVLLEKMTIFQEEIEMRQVVANRYMDTLGASVQAPVIPGHSISAWAQFSVMTTQRNELMGKLKTAAIPAMIYYPKPLHLQAAFSYLGYSRGTMPVSEHTSEHIMSLPMHPYLKAEEQLRITEIINL